MKLPVFCKSINTGKKAPKRGGSIFSRRRHATPAGEEGLASFQAAADERPMVPRLQLVALSLEDEAPSISGAAADSPAEAGAAATDPMPPRPSAALKIAERAAQLRAAAQAAKADRTNSLALADFADGLVEAVQDAEVMLPHSLPAPALSEIEALLGNAAILVASCSAPGWLLLAATPGGCACDAMDGLVTRMLAAFKEGGLDCVPSQRLTPPALSNGTRALNRRLRQLGGGCLAAGLQLLAGNEEEQHTLAQELGVAPQDVSGDAAHILAAGLVEAAPAEAAAATASDVISAHRPALEAAFATFAAFGLRGEAAATSATEIDSFRCYKLIRQAGLLGGAGELTSQALDVMFAAAKARGARRLSFNAFLRLLSMVADKTGMELGDVAAAVAGTQAPAVRATTPEAVRLHDDPSTYTGVYARGGMRTTDERIDLRSLVDRDAADKRRVSTRRTSTSSMALPLSRTVSSLAVGTSGSGAATPRGRTASVVLKTPGTGASTSGAATPRPAGASSHTAAGLTPRAPLASFRPAAAPALADDTPEARNLRLVFMQFAQFGKSAGARPSLQVLELDSAQFAKLCRDSKLVGKAGLDGTRVDLIFRAAVGMGTRSMSFQQFMGSLPALAAARGCAEAEIVRRLLGCEDPSRCATTPDVPGLADRSNFSGIAARGGLSTVEKRVTLEGLCDRSGRRSSLPVAPVLH